MSMGNFAMILCTATATVKIQLCYEVHEPLLCRILTYNLSLSCPGICSAKVAATAEGSPLVPVLDEPSGIYQWHNSSGQTTFFATFYPAFKWTSFGSCSIGRAKQRYQEKSFVVHSDDMAVIC